MTAYSSRAWDRLCADAYNLYGYTCCLCGQPIDPTLPRTHRLSKTIHHLDPVALHGTALPHITRVRPAHRACNSAVGDGTRTTTTNTANQRTSRQW